MLIRVRYPNGTYDMVKEQTLDHLLEEGKVASFKRTEGWALVGRDPIRYRSVQDNWHQNRQERRGIPQKRKAG